MWKRLIPLVVSLTLSPGTALTAEAGAASEHPIVIGMQIPMYHPIFESACDSANEKAKALGVTLKITQADTNVDKEERQINEFVSQGVQGILLWSISPEDPVAPNIEAAVKAGIPVALVSTPVNTDKALVFVTEDSAEVGRIAAEFVVGKLHNKGSILELEGPPGFRSPMKTTFEERLKNSNITITARENVEEIYRSYAKTVAASLIQRHPDFDGVFAYDDEMILGTMDAMEKLGIDPAKKLMVGVNKSPSTLRYLKDGTLSATINVFFGKQAEQALQYLVDYIKNKSMPPQKVVLIKPELVTKESLPSN